MDGSPDRPQINHPSPIKFLFGMDLCDATGAAVEVSPPVTSTATTSKTCIIYNYHHCITIVSLRTDTFVMFSS